MQILKQAMGYQCMASPNIHLIFPCSLTRSVNPYKTPMTIAVSNGFILKADQNNPIKKHPTNILPIFNICLLYHI